MMWNVFIFARGKTNLKIHWSRTQHQLIASLGLFLTGTDFLSFLRISDTLEANGEDSSSSEEEREDKKTDVNVVHDEESNTQGIFQKGITNSKLLGDQVNGPNHYCSDDEDDLAIIENAVPTISFSHTVEPKRVCIASILRFLLWGLVN